MPAKRIISDDEDDGDDVGVMPSPVPAPAPKRSKLETTAAAGPAPDDVQRGMCSDDEAELAEEAMCRPGEGPVTVVIKNLSQLIQVASSVGKGDETLEFTVINDLAPFDNENCSVASIPGIQCNAQLNELALMINDQQFTKNQRGIQIEFGTGSEFYNFFIQAEDEIKGLPEGEKVVFHLPASKLFSKLIKASDKSSEARLIIHPDSIDFMTYRREAGMSFNKIRVRRVDVNPPLGRVSELTCAFDKAASGNVEDFMHAVRQGESASDGVCELSIETVQMKESRKLQVVKVTTYTMSEAEERSSKAWIVEDDGDDPFYTMVDEQITEEDDDDEDVGRQMEEQMRIADITDTLSKEIVSLDDEAEDDSRPNVKVRFDIGPDGNPRINTKGDHEYCRVAVVRPLAKRLMTFLDAFQSRKTHYMALLNTTKDLLCVLIPSGNNWALLALPGRVKES